MELGQSFARALILFDVMRETIAYIVTDKHLTKPDKT